LGPGDNETNQPHPWDTHSQFSIKTLLSTLKQKTGHGSKPHHEFEEFSAADTIVIRLQGQVISGAFAGHDLQLSFFQISAADTLLHN